jgi:DNA-binding transcriptional MerR regulator
VKISKQLAPKRKTRTDYHLNRSCLIASVCSALPPTPRDVSRSAEEHAFQLKDGQVTRIAFAASLVDAKMASKPNYYSDRKSDEAIPFDGHGVISMPTDQPLSIGNVARMLGVSRLRLLSYELLGLTRRHRRVGQGFVYGWDDCGRLSFIIKAGKVGLSARQLAPLIRAAGAGASDEAIESARLQCLTLISQLDRRYQALRQVLAEINSLYEFLSDKSPGSVAPNTADRRDVSDSK